MDDAAFERLLDKRDRNAYFKALDKAAKYAKVKPTQRPRKKAQATRTPRGAVGPSDSAPMTQNRAPGPASTYRSHCIRCERPMRQWFERVADRPGTITHQSNGVCVSCVQGRSSKLGRPRLRPDNCRSCGRAMRAHRATLAEAPGTVPHGKGDLCVTCLKKEKRS